MIEAKKLAYEDRAKFYADPDFARVPVATLISKPYAARRRAEIEPRSGQSASDAPASPTQADTIYMTVVDRDFNCVSLIQSNFHGFGSYHVAGRPGLRAPEPRLPLRARPEPSQPARAAEAAVPHDHPGLRHQGRQALAELRADGRRHAGPGARPGALQHDRLRHGRAGGRRRAAVPPLRLVRADRPAGRRRRLGRAGVGDLRRGPARSSRPRGTAWSSRPAASAATRRSASTSSAAS